MALPFLAAATTAYPIFLIMSRGRDYTPHSIEFQEEEPAVQASSVLFNKWGTTFEFFMLAAVLGVWSVPAYRRYLIGRSLRHRRLLLARDTVYDWNASRSTILLGSIGTGRTTVASRTGVIEDIPPPQVSQDVQRF